MKVRSSLPPPICVGSPVLRMAMSGISSRSSAICQPLSLVGLIELSIGWCALKSPPISVGDVEAWVNSSPSSRVARED